MKRIICITIVFTLIFFIAGCTDKSSYSDYDKELYEQLYEEEMKKIDAQLVKQLREMFGESGTELDDENRKYNDPQINHSVKITINHKNGMMGEASGFLISPTTIVTAFHSMINIDDILIETPTQTSTVVGVRGYDANRDIAILELDTAIDYPIIDYRNAAYELDKGQDIVVQGYADGQYQIINGYVVNPDRKTVYGDYFIDLNLPDGKPGFSGGAVITSQGEFCGMLLSGNEDSDSATIMSYKFIIDFIKNHEDAELIPIETFNEKFLVDMNLGDAVEPKTPEEKLCVDYMKYFFNSVNSRTNNPTELNLSDEVRKDTYERLAYINSVGWIIKYSIKSITTWNDASKSYINVVFENQVKIEADNGGKALHLMIFVVPKDKLMIENIATTRYSYPGYAHEKYGFTNDFNELITWKFGKQQTLSTEEINKIIRKVYEILVTKIDKKYLHMGNGKERPKNFVYEKYATGEKFTEDDKKQLSIVYVANYNDFAIIEIYRMYEPNESDYFFVNIHTLECSKGHGVFN